TAARGGPTNSYTPLFEAVKRASSEVRDTSSTFEVVKRTTPVRDGSGEAQRQKVVKRASLKPVKNQNMVDLYRPVSAKVGANTEFESFWRAYPHRGEHPDPKNPARLQFGAVVRRGTDPADIIRVAENYASYVAANVSELRFVMQAVTWLNRE